MRRQLLTPAPAAAAAGVGVEGDGVWHCRPSLVCQDGRRRVFVDRFRKHKHFGQKLSVPEFAVIGILPQDQEDMSLRCPNRGLPGMGAV